jgi:hypothetical protein
VAAIQAALGLRSLDHASSVKKMAAANAMRLSEFEPVADGSNNDSIRSGLMAMADMIGQKAPKEDNNV